MYDVINSSWFGLPLNYHYTEPLNEASPEYLWRLSETALLGCRNVYEGINKTITKEKEERLVGKVAGKNNWIIHWIIHKQ